jgi:hypothetical protein
MHVVEKSPDRLKLSDANSSWGTWVFVGGIMLVLLTGMVIAVIAFHPVCWSGFFIAAVLLFLLIRELMRSFDRELLFDREKAQLLFIRRPWLGKVQVEQIPLEEISAVSLIERPQPRNYPGYDYIEDENRPPVEREYDVVLDLRSGDRRKIYWGGGEAGAGQLRREISDFLGLE